MKTAIARPRVSVPRALVPWVLPALALIAGAGCKTTRGSSGTSVELKTNNPAHVRVIKREQLDKDGTVRREEQIDVVMKGPGSARVKTTPAKPRKEVPAPRGKAAAPAPVVKPPRARPAGEPPRVVMPPKPPKLTARQAYIRRLVCEEGYKPSEAADMWNAINHGCSGKH